MSVCKGCGMEIRWIRTTNGRAMPVNPERVRFHAEGGPETFVEENGKVIRGRRRNDGSEWGFIPHWATCRAAGHFKEKVNGNAAE